MKMQSNRTRNRDSRRGQSMVEFALGFGLLMMLIVGIFEMGRAMWSYTTVSFAARQAARFAIVRSEMGASGADSSLIDSAVKANAVGLNPDRLVITKTWTPDNSRGSQFAITVQYPVDFVGAPLFLKGRTGVIVGSTATYTILN